jgi:hypothetical protein
MASRSLWRFALCSVYVVLLFHYQPLASAAEFVHSDSRLSLSANPSAVVIKVGGNTTVNLTFTSALSTSQVCFGQEGFPASGFVLIFLPQCAAVQQPVTRTKLNVEATPAAAPQNFTALILATLGNQTASTPLTITVVPAIPAWIPWLGVLLFFLVIGAALIINPRKSAKRKGKGKMGG